MGLMLAATLTFTNCTTEMVNPYEEDTLTETPSEGYPFEVTATTAKTKTVNDGMNTNWVAGDKINLFHAVTDMTSYVTDGAFTITAENLEAEKFTGTLNGELDADEEYDWYAFYPYTSQITTPANTTTYVTVGSKTNSVQTQAGNNSMAHIAGTNYPIVGKGIAQPAGATPSIEMTHATSLVKVVVTNNTDDPLAVEDIYFVATEDVVGTFYVDFTEAVLTSEAFKSSGESYTSNTAKLSVTGAEELAKGESAEFYFAVKPFVAKSGSTLEVYVNGAVKEIELSKDVTFTAGKVKTVNYNYVATEVAGPEELTVEEFLAKEVSDAVWYKLTGIVSNIYNTQYGNFYLTDDTGTVTVYGLKASEDAANTTFSTLGLKEGDQVTLIGNRAAYNNTAQVGKGYYVSHVSSCLSPVISCTDNVVTIEAEEGTTIYYTINGDDPNTNSSVYNEPFEINETITVKAIAVAEGKINSGVASRNCAYVDPNAGPSQDIAPSGTVLWAETWAEAGANSTTFGSNSAISTYDYAGRSGYGDNASNVTYSADASNNVRITKSSGANCTSGHLWFNKSVAGELTTSAIKLYGVTSLSFSHSQGTSGSSCQTFYSVDNGTTWTSLGTQSGPIEKKTYTFEVPVNTESIRIKLSHASSNSKNTRVDNLELKAN